MATDFGIKTSGLRKPARFEMTGVECALAIDSNKPHALLVHHLGVSNPKVMSALLKGERPNEIDAVDQLVERGGIAFENLNAEPTPENLKAYFAQLIDGGHGKLVLDLWTFAYDVKSFGVPATDPVKLGEA